FPVSEISSSMWKDGQDLLSLNGKDMLLNGRAPKTGEIMFMPKLARLRGRLENRFYYTGRIAQAIVDLVQSQGGVMSLEDLASHTSTRVDPICIDYKGFTVWECPPNGQGITALIALGILESLQKNGVVKDLGDMKHNSAEYLHAVIESLRLAFEDSKYYVTDPEIYPIPVKELLSKDYLAKRANLFDPKMAKIDVERGSPENSSDTVYFSIVDEEGNA
ncbi:6364_t:CDS:2, partial [Acaulospora morrowiae]